MIQNKTLPKRKLLPMTFFYQVIPNNVCKLNVQLLLIGSRRRHLVGLQMCTLLVLFLCSFGIREIIPALTVSVLPNIENACAGLFLLQSALKVSDRLCTARLTHTLLIKLQGGRTGCCRFVKQKFCSFDLRVQSSVKFGFVQQSALLYSSCLIRLGLQTTCNV